MYPIWKKTNPPKKNIICSNTKLMQSCRKNGPFVNIYSISLFITKGYPVSIPIESKTKKFMERKKKWPARRMGHGNGSKLIYEKRVRIFI